jgi:membrane-anchored glycerophosphoryl diester phosphodiesterase (GDPDase)
VNIVACITILVFVLLNYIFIMKTYPSITVNICVHKCICEGKTLEVISQLGDIYSTVFRALKIDYSVACRELLLGYGTVNNLAA